VIQIAGLFAARVRIANKGPRLALLELAGTIQRGNQNETRERSRPQGQRSLSLLPNSGRCLSVYLCADLHILSNVGDHRAAFSIVLVGNQIAEWYNE
jgi:hypothetical protein